MWSGHRKGITKPIFNPFEHHVTSSRRLTAGFKWLEVGRMDAMAHLRELFGSQKAIADALGVGVSTVSMWNVSPTGIPLPRRVELVRICRERGLAVNIGLVFGEEFADAFGKGGSVSTPAAAA